MRFGSRMQQRVIGGAARKNSRKSARDPTHRHARCPRVSERDSVRATAGPDSAVYDPAGTALLPLPQTRIENVVRDAAEDGMVDGHRKACSHTPRNRGFVPR